MRDPAIFDVLVESYERSWDAGFYLGLAEASPGPILELGVGTGRLFSPLTAAGHEVWGIDLEERMLELGRRKIERRHGSHAAKRLLVGDARDFDLGRRFGLILLSYNFLCLVRPPDLEAVSERVRTHLAPNGRVGFDFIVADASPWARMPYSWRSTKELVVEGQAVDYEAVARFDAETRIHTIDEHAAYADGRTVTETLELYQWRVDDLLGELGRLGWEFDDGPTDDQGAAYTPVARVCRGILRRRDDGKVDATRP